jgi:glutamyl-tRNA reductase
MIKRIHVVGLSHKTAPVEIRERFALAGWNPVAAGLVHEQSPIAEAVILSTCNRVEWIVVGGPSQDLAQHVLHGWAAACHQPVDLVEPYIYHHAGQKAIAHVFTVASSLDSMVVGEPQILGQLKSAYRQAVEWRATRIILNRLFHKAFSTAKRVRTETAIASSAVSISYAAVELARKIFSDLSRHTALLVGAGEMAELAATHLLAAGVQRISVANRTLSRAQELAARFHGQSYPFEALATAIQEADIVITSTGSPHVILTADHMREIMRARRQRPIFLIDIAVPRDIDPSANAIDNVYLYDIDDLNGVVEENRASRKQEALKAQAIIQEEVDAFVLWLDGLRLQPTIVALLAQGESIARKELRKSIRQLGPNPDPQVVAIMERLAHSICHKIYHEPIAYLKRRSQEEGAAERCIHQARQMFNLDGPPPQDAHEDRKRRTSD